jgi:hypothetical protein
MNFELFLETFRYDGFLGRIFLKSPLTAIGEKSFSNDTKCPSPDWRENPFLQKKIWKESWISS